MDLRPRFARGSPLSRRRCGRRTVATGVAVDDPVEDDGFGEATDGGFIGASRAVAR